MKRLLWLVLLLSGAPFARACSCAGPNPVCSRFGDSPAIFTGRVVGGSLVSGDVEPFVDGDGKMTPMIGPGHYRVRFEVSETFKGEALTEITVSTSEQSTACGFPFKKGSEYVVFTYKDRKTGELWTSICSGTHELKSGVEDADISWMRGVAKAPPGATIFGTFKVAGGANVPRPANVDVQGPEHHLIEPDQDGSYSMKGLPPGEYTVTASVPAGFSTLSARKESVVDKGCAEVDWPVYYDGHVKGQVMDSSGAPVKDVFLELLPRDKSERGYSILWPGTTDAAGRFDFSKMTPGDYSLVANPIGPTDTLPYPSAYYPNAETLNDAAVLHLGPSATLNHIDITFRPAWRPVAVHVEVVLQDGSPAVEARVEAHDANPLKPMNAVMDGTDKNGKTTLTVFEGRSYYLTAYIFNDEPPPRCAGPLKFTAKDGMTLTKLKIGQERGDCLAH